MECKIYLRGLFLTAFLISNQGVVALEASAQSIKPLECAAFAKTKTAEYPETEDIFRKRLKAKTLSTLFKAVEGAKWMNTVQDQLNRASIIDPLLKTNGDLQDALSVEMDRQNLLSESQRRELEWGDCSRLKESLSLECGGERKCFINLNNYPEFQDYLQYFEILDDPTDLPLDEYKKFISRKVETLKTLFSKGYIDAMYYVARMYHVGVSHLTFPVVEQIVTMPVEEQIVTVDLDEAIRFYTLAADKGDMLSATELASIYFGDLEKTKKYENRELHAKYLKIAADNGWGPAASEYSLLLRLGRGVIQNQKLSNQYLRKALELGSGRWEDAFFNFFLGRGVELSYEFAYASLLIDQAKKRHDWLKRDRDINLEMVKKRLTKDAQERSIKIAEKCLGSAFKQCILLDAMTVP